MVYTEEFFTRTWRKTWITLFWVECTINVNEMCGCFPPFIFPRIFIFILDIEMLPLSLHHTQAAAGRWLGSCSSSHSVARPCRWICVRVGGTFRVQAILMLFLVCTFRWAHTCNFPSQSEMRGEPFLYSEGELISRATSSVILCLFSRWAQKPRPAGLCVSSFS